MISVMTLLQQSNPVPDPAELADSDEARELAMRRPGSVLDWHIHDDEYVGDGYRIRLLEPEKWEVTHRETVLETPRSLKRAFAKVERHRRDTLRRRDLWVWGSLFVAALVTGISVSQLAPAASIAVLPVVFFVGISALIRVAAALSRSVTDPYQRRLPWEPKPWWRRLLGL